MSKFPFRLGPIVKRSAEPRDAHGISSTQCQRLNGVHEEEEKCFVLRMRGTYDRPVKTLFLGEGAGAGQLQA
jgi:hypothetical protein